VLTNLTLRCKIKVILECKNTSKLGQYRINIFYLRYINVKKVKLQYKYGPLQPAKEVKTTIM